MDNLVFGVSDFIAVFNQTIEYAYPNISILGELANFRVSKNRWVYFDLKDATSSLRFFGTVMQLPGPLEDGMMLQVNGQPKLHDLYGFSINVRSIQLSGEGSIKKAAELLKLKLEKEGLFDINHKRPIPYPPKTIGLITSSESAAFRDFMKILNNRWGGVEIRLIDVQVQGEASAQQIVDAVTTFNQSANPPEVIVITRGGGSAEDLQSFSTENVTRSVYSSRIPTVVAIGHEVDVSLSELAADRRASTPSNAAELLVPDRSAVIKELELTRKSLLQATANVLSRAKQYLKESSSNLTIQIEHYFLNAERQLLLKSKILEAFNPQLALQRGYSIIRQGSSILNSGLALNVGDKLNIEMIDSIVDVETKNVTIKDNYGQRTR